eukprot:996322-Pleurochrysis_carterae.AAC.2
MDSQGGSKASEQGIRYRRCTSRPPPQRADSTKGTQRKAAAGAAARADWREKSPEIERTQTTAGVRCLPLIEARGRCALHSNRARWSTLHLTRSRSAGSQRSQSKRPR